MTDLEPIARPSCPVCGANDEVERQMGGWLCTGCWTVFSGSADEWARWRERRENRAKRYAWSKEHADA